jgi:hypothetical protein
VFHIACPAQSNSISTPVSLVTHRYGRYPPIRHTHIVSSHSHNICVCPRSAVVSAHLLSSSAQQNAYQVASPHQAVLVSHCTWLCSHGLSSSMLQISSMLLLAGQGARLVWTRPGSLHHHAASPQDGVPHGRPSHEFQPGLLMP